MEKSVVFGLALGSKKGSSALSDLVTSYASLLASQVRGRKTGQGRRKREGEGEGIRFEG